jgi:hypothetical protein
MRPHDHPAPTAWVGIDVSKDILGACLLPAQGRPRFRSFANDAGGHAELLTWADGCRTAGDVRSHRRSRRSADRRQLIRHPFSPTQPMHHVQKQLMVLLPLSRVHAESLLPE